MDPEGKSRKKVTADKMRNRLAGLCARSEQCTSDLRRKMIVEGLTREETDDVLDELIKHKFVDDRRYSVSLARDKVRFSGWGKYKIRQYLAAKHIPNDIVEEALSAIDTSEYKESLIRVTKAKSKNLDLRNPTDREKLIRHIVGRGFEMKYAVQICEQLYRRLRSQNPEL